MSHRAAFGTGLLAAAAILLLGPTSGALARDAAPRQAAGSYDNRYEVRAGESVTDTLANLGADDLLVYESIEVGALTRSGAGTLTVTGTSPGDTFNFVATDGFAGTVTAPYTGTTADDVSFTASIVFEITAPEPANRPPVANGDGVTVDPGSTVGVDVLANDRDADAGDLLTLVGVSPSLQRSVAVDTSGSRIRVRTPLSAEPGQRRFTYTVADGAGATATATLLVTVRYAPVTPTTAPPRTTPTVRPTQPGRTTPTSNRPADGPSTTRPGRRTTTTTAAAGAGDDAGDDGTTSTTDRRAPSDDEDDGAGSNASVSDDDETAVGAGATGTPDGDADLPTTGDDSGNGVIIGVALVIAGIVLVAVAGRRRFRHPDRGADPTL